MSIPLSFDLTTVNQALTGTRFSKRVQHFATIDSTNSQLLAAAGNGAEEGTVYVAAEQTAGRGRGGHHWHSSPGDGLYLSVLVRPPMRIREALLLSLATGLAAQSAVREVCKLETDIRWPNDLLMGSKKCGGILVETAVECSNLRYAVIGIGLNLNHATLPPEIAPFATSLRIESHTSISREAMLVALLRALDLELTGLESAKPGLLERFTAASTWVSGRRVHVAEAGGYTGITDGLDAYGFLRVAADDGTVRTVLSGGVREAN